MGIPKEDFDAEGIDPNAVSFPDPLRKTDHADDEIKEAGVDKDLVEEVVRDGIIIEAYRPTGRGWSYLLMGWIERESLPEPKPLHVVAAPKERKTMIVTVYDPSRKANQWNEDYTKRL